MRGGATYPTKARGAPAISFRAASAEPTTLDPSAARSSRCPSTSALGAQATVVLSCPGITVRGWGSRDDGSPLGAIPDGLTSELAAVQREFHRQPIELRLRECARRWRTLKSRLDRAGGWSEPSEIRASTTRRVRDLARGSFPPPPPPPASEGIDALPLLFDRSAGLVAISDHPSGWELISVEETGRTSRSLGVWPSPSQLPSVSSGGEDLLRAYLLHLLDRDFTYWSAAERLRVGGHGTLSEAVEEDIGRFGALVLARAQLLQRFRSEAAAPLSGGLVWDGIRATDGEFLDRPTLGWVL